MAVEGFLLTMLLQVHNMADQKRRITCHDTSSWRLVLDKQLAAWGNLGSDLDGSSLGEKELTYI